MQSWFFVNLANVLFALAYIVKDIFWLRIFSIVACSANIVYLFIVPDKPLWWGIGWDVVFIIINAVWVYFLIMEKRGLHFNDEEKELFETVFSDLSPLEYRRLLNVAHWENHSSDTVLAKENEMIQSLMLIARGVVRVERNGRTITVLKSGDFVGEMSYVSEDSASATVTVEDSTRMLSWNKEKLQKVLDEDPGLKMSLSTVLSCNMAHKLKRQN